MKRDGDLHKRLRLFDMSVTQTLLWCSESWLLAQEVKRRLKSTQNNMLRRVAGARRRPDEDYVEWIQKSTHTALREAKHSGIRLWVEEHHRAKWHWAGHVLRMDEHWLAKRATAWRDSQRWALESTTFTPSLRIRRPLRKRWFRWEDDLKRFATT